MEKLRCLNCGSIEIEKLGNVYKCGHCSASYEDDKIEQMTQEIRSIFGEELSAQKEEQIANVRQNLWEAAHADNLSSKEISKWADEMKKLLPDDFQARFYTAALGPARELNAFLNNIDAAENSMFMEDVIGFMIKSLEKSNVLPLKELITRSFKGEKYTKYMTAVEDEAEKLKAGIYSTQIPRDVFIAYSSKDFKAVNEIVEFLESNKIECFVAMRNLRHGKGAVENYEKALKEAMHNCKCVVFISTENSRDMDCDALKVELPYIRDNEPQMGRIEYLLEEYTNTGYAAKRICENFFSGLEYCRSREDLVDRILTYITGFGGKKEQPAEEVKYCLNCGEKNPIKAKRCMECGSDKFAESYEEYLNVKNEEEQARVKEKFEAEQAAARKKLEEEYAEKFRKQQEELEKQRAELEQQRATAERKAEEGRIVRKEDEEERRKSEETETAGMSEEVKGYYKKAVAGDPVAQNNLGNCYDYGRGVTEDAKKAAEWYTKAAKQGHADAQCRLGLFYANGRGVKRNSEKAIKWYRKSAEQGDIFAQKELGMCYEFGTGVFQSYAKAVKWYRKAAEQGDAWAQEQLKKPELKKYL